MPLLSLMARRRLSTVADQEEQEFNANISDTQPVNTKSYHGLGPGDRKVFIQNVKIEASKLSRELDIGLLEAEFERDFRPLLASHCLMLPHTIDHDTTAYFHGPTHGISSLDPLYLSSLDIMVRMTALKELQRKALIDHIIKQRVLVADDWLNSYGNVEILEYDFGASGADFVRGECDASWTKLTLNQGAGGGGAASRAGGGGAASGAIIRTGIAKFAIIIWKERHLLWAEIFEGISCSDSHHAEVLAALALLMKCEEKKFSCVDVWSDSRRAIGIISGAETIKMDDANRDECLLLRSMRKKFTKVVPIQKPRELMFLADQLLRLDGYSSCYMKKAIQMWASHLRGYPLFSITRNSRTTSIIDSFVGTRQMKAANGYTYSPETTFFCKVEKEHKLEELQKLRAYLLPSCVQLVIDASVNEQPRLQKQLDGMFPEMKTAGGITTFRDLVAVDPSQRALVIVWDSTIARADYYRKDSCIIILVEEDEAKEMKKRGINEINVETYLYFHRGEFKLGSQSSRRSRSRRR